MTRAITDLLACSRGKTKRAAWRGRCSALGTGLGAVRLPSPRFRRPKRPVLGLTSAEETEAPKDQRLEATELDLGLPLHPGAGSVTVTVSRTSWCL